MRNIWLYGWACKIHFQVLVEFQLYQFTHFCSRPHRSQLTFLLKFKNGRATYAFGYDSLCNDPNICRNVAFGYLS